eukprot:UN26115
MSDRETKNTRQELKRTTKWQEMLYGRSGRKSLINDLGSINSMKNRLQYWQKNIIKLAKLKTRLRKGIPRIFRSDVWVHITGAREYRIKHPDLYKELCKETSGQTCHYDKQIKKDINRAYQQHSIFSEDNSHAQESLYNVMRAYTFYNKGLGYNQA